jgi:NAD(P)-dependent dehydrogenase (short-subunit alcohol dehydrogenase family)
METADGSSGPVAPGFAPAWRPAILAPTTASAADVLAGRRQEKEDDVAGILARKVALVTGAGSGIGRASAVALAAEGARVLVSDLDATGGEETVARIRAAGGEARFWPADVTRADQVAALVEQALAAYGRLDCAHNNAGIEGTTGTPTHRYAEDDWDRVIATNLKGVWLGLKHEIPIMLRQGGGAIVNTASVAGLVGFPGASAYAASKHAVNGLTKTAALEYAPHGIRVNSVCPAFIRTPMVERVIAGDPEREVRLAAQQPIGRMGRPEEVAAAVVWLCSDAASFVTGSTMTIDGGLFAR